MSLRAKQDVICVHAACTARALNCAGELSAIGGDEADEGCGDFDVEGEFAVDFCLKTIARRHQEFRERQAKERPVTRDQVETVVYDSDREGCGDRAEAFH